MPVRASRAGLALLAIVACRNDRSATTAGSTTNAPGATAPAPNVVTYIARDYGFEGPAQIPAGLTIFRLDNQGKELHHLVIARIDQGRASSMGGGG